MTPDPGPVDAGPSSSTRPGRPGGLVLQPFRALRYAVPDSELALVTSPPYDVVDEAGAAVLEELSPSNVVRLILPRDTPDAQDRPAAAAARLAAWRRDGVLRQDAVPALHVYEQAEPEGGHVQRGLLGALALSPPDDGIVLPHEDTMADVVAERLALYSAVRADLEPILLVHDSGRSGGAARELVAGIRSERPLVDAVLPDGLRHRLWAVTDPAVLAAVAEDLQPRRAVIADGHHRYATYLRRQAEQRAAGAGDGPWDHGLALLVDVQDHGPRVHPVHRVVAGVEAGELARRSALGAAVRDLDGDDLGSALEALARAGQHGPAFLLVSGDRGTVRLVTDPDPAQVDAALPPSASEEWRELDVVVLHRVLVPALWGLPDRPDVVTAAVDVDRALAAAARTGGTAVLLGPTPLAALTAAAVRGERLPRKATQFTPKPRTGLVLRPYDDDPPTSGSPGPA